MKMRAAATLGAMLATSTIVSAQTTGPMRVTQTIETSTAEATAAVMMAGFRRDKDSQKEFPDGGWSLSASLNLGAWFAVVGEVDGYANSYDKPSTTPGYGARLATNHVHDFLAGPRGLTPFFRVGHGRTANDLRLFGQLLAGTRESQVFPGGRAIQPGGGADFHTKSGLTLRTEADYCFVSGRGRPMSGSRFLFGLVFGPS